jgi:AcrR family transcriptional regulator
MSESEPDAKGRILQVTIDILNEVDDPTRITVRQIAERADVGIGSINYHFQSKDNLLNEAVGKIMMEEAGHWFEPVTDTDIDPVTRLKMLFKQTSQIAVRYAKLSHLMLAYILQHGEFSVSMMTLPLMREIFGSTKNDLELRLLTAQLVVPMQAIFVRAEAFRRYAGLDLFNDAQRDQAIDIMVDNLVGHHLEN